MKYKNIQAWEVKEGDYVAFPIENTISPRLGRLAFHKVKDVCFPGNHLVGITFTVYDEKTKEKEWYARVNSMQPFVFDVCS